MALLGGAAYGQQGSDAAPARIDQELVKSFVVKAHQRDTAPMRELLKKEPALLQAAWDWGAGDWESALQAAAHTGSRDMALFLLDAGARIDTFAITMLGNFRRCASCSKVSRSLLKCAEPTASRC
jgi:hypothetical protein